MTDSPAPFSTGELHALAQANANLFLFSTLAFLKEHHIPTHEWTDFLRIRLEPLWQTRQALKAVEIATLIGKNLVSAGARLVQLDGTDERAEVLVEWDVVHQYINRFAPLTPDDFAPMLEFYGALTERMGYHYHCAWNNPIIHITITNRNIVSEPRHAPYQERE